jgi:hypothetical protein
MARRKTKKKHHRRRRIGAAGGMAVVLQKFVGLTVGAAGGFFVNDALKKAFTSLPTFVPGAVVAAGGIFVDKTLAKNNELIRSVANGLMAAGGLIVLNETVISLPGISGVGFVTNYDRNYKNDPALMRAVGAPGFMDSSIGTVRDLASVGEARVGAVYDN